LLIFGATALTILLTDSPARAFPIFNPFNFHYYEAIPGSYDWHEAQTLAQSMTLFGTSGHLATLTSVDENNWVWDHLNQPTRYLLGATDEQTEGDWQWVTGEQWNDTHWNTGEPNDGFGNYPEDALSFWDNSRWNDLPILGDYWQNGIPYVYGFVMEWDFNSNIPEPSTAMLMGIGFVGLGVIRTKKYFL